MSLPRELNVPRATRNSIADERGEHAAECEDLELRYALAHRFNHYPKLLEALEELLDPGLAIRECIASVDRRCKCRICSKARALVTLKSAAPTNRETIRKDRT